MQFFNKSLHTVRFYRLLFHISALVLILLVPVLLRPDSDMPRRMPMAGGFINRWLIVCIITAFLYFINVYVLIPKYLKVGKYFQYLLWLIAGFILMTILAHELIQYFSPRGLPFMEGMRPRPRGAGVGLTFSPMFISLALGISFEMILNWEIQRKEKAQIERERMSSELSFLKSQVNPHFLFNSLNSIYALSEQQSPKTGEAILLLSNLMRYMLYGSNNGKIELSTEVQCVENFITLQKMRISSREDISITLAVEGKDMRIMIEPLILMPFVENAFKHGVSYNQKSEVKIRISADDNQVLLHVFNTKKGIVQADPNSRETDSGIGLANIKRRLHLLYPNKHKLEITDEPESFDVMLRIQV